MHRVANRLQHISDTVLPRWCMQCVPAPVAQAQAQQQAVLATQLALPAAYQPPRCLHLISPYGELVEHIVRKLLLTEMPMTQLALPAAYRPLRSLPVPHRPLWWVQISCTQTTQSVPAG